MLSDADGLGVGLDITCSAAGMRTARGRGAVGGAGGAGPARLTAASPRRGSARRRRRRGVVFCKGCLALSNMEEAPAAGVTCERD